MPYRRHQRCPLLTAHGHILLMIHHSTSLRRIDIVEATKLSDNHVGRVLGELAAEGLIVMERASQSVWWSVPTGFDIEGRMWQDRSLKDRPFAAPAITIIKGTGDPVPDPCHNCCPPRPYDCPCGEFCTGHSQCKSKASK